MAFAPKACRGRGTFDFSKIARLVSNPGVNVNRPVEMKDYIRFKAVRESLQLCLQETTQQNLNACLAKTEGFATSEKNIKKVVSAMFESCLCLNAQNFAANSGQVAATLFTSETMGPTFRNIFFSQFQETYNDRKHLRKTDFGKYLCFSIFLCSIYKDVRVNDDQVLTILTKPVYTVLGELLDNMNEDVLQWQEMAMEVFHFNLLMVTSVLQVTDERQMDDLLIKVRASILKESSPTVKCILLDTYKYLLLQVNGGSDRKDKNYNLS